MCKIGMIESLPYELVDYDTVVYGQHRGGVDVDHYELRDDGLHHIEREHVEVISA